MNVSDADAADMEELLKTAPDLPKGGWYSAPFAPSLIEEIAAMQSGVIRRGPVSEV